MVKGLDNGYLYTKDNERRMFKSAFTTDTTMSGYTNIIIDGVSYCVGSGSTTVDLDKTNHEINKVCTITDLAMSGQKDYFLVVGLPIGQYAKQKDKLCQTVMNYNNAKVFFRGEEFSFNIREVMAFPQGAGALLSLNILNGDFIVFDIGGLTIDVAWIEMHYGAPLLQKYDTWFEGTQKIYSNIVHEVNNRYGLTLEPSYAEKILINDLIIDGEKQSKDFLIPILKTFIEPILKDFELNYPSKTTQIYLCGGGANIFHDMFKSKFKSVILMPDSQYANAIGYHKIGCQHWDRYLRAVRG